jgi:hypothetical protein
MERPAGDERTGVFTSAVVSVVRDVTDSEGDQAEGYGNLTLTLEHQAAFVEEAPEIFLPIPGGFGRMGQTHIRLAAANEDILTGALRTAWKLRIEKNAKKRPERRGLPPRGEAVNRKGGRRLP